MLSPSCFHILTLVGLALTTGCTSNEKGSKQGSLLEANVTPLTVFAAASLTDAFQEIERVFEAKYSDINVVLNLAGSQQLTQQLRLGAPADVFAPADLSKMETGIEAGRVHADTPKVFAGNQLVVIVPEDNPAGISSLQDLARQGLKLVLAAEEVPVGQYTNLFLEKAAAHDSFDINFRQMVLGRTVSFEQSVRAVRTKVVLGEADAGIVYKSDVYTNDPTNFNNQRFRTIEIPQEINPTAHYPIAPVLDSPNADLARKFVRFVLSENGQQILVRHGFISI